MIGLRALRKVMAWIVTRLFARGYGLLNGILEASPVIVAQERLEVAGAPVFGTVVVGLFEALETCGPCLGQMVVGHVRFPPALSPLRSGQ